MIGGAGYIGSHVCKRLSECYTPIVYDNLSTGHSWALQWGQFVRGDLKESAKLQRTFEQYQPKAVVHLASLINVRESIVNPALYYEKNLFGTLALLKAMVKARVPYIVFSSTAAIFGSPQYLPIDEKHPKAPLNAYGKTKLAIEGMLEDFSHAHGMQFGALRYFNACGADPEAGIGEDHTPETHLIPLVIRTALGLQPQLCVYGADHPTPDGFAIRDYIHVKDLAEVHLKALHHLFEERGSFQVNIGTGRGYSVREVIDAVRAYGQREVAFEIKPRFTQDSPVLIADNRLAQKLLAWEPCYSDLPTIIRDAWEWQKLLTARHWDKDLLKKLQSIAKQPVSSSSW